MPNYISIINNTDCDWLAMIDHGTLNYEQNGKSLFRNCNNDILFIFIQHQLVLQYMENLYIITHGLYQSAKSFMHCFILGRKKPRLKFSSNSGL